MRITRLMRYRSQLVQFLALLTASFMLLFVNTQEAFSAMKISSANNDQTVIEYLRLHVDDENRQAWLAAEKGSWEQWLSNKKGFLGRELFWDPLREEATVMITWASASEWKSIPQGEIDAVQERFEKLARERTGREYGNPFPLIFEGELFPQ